MGRILLFPSVVFYATFLTPGSEQALFVLAQSKRSCCSSSLTFTNQRHIYEVVTKNTDFFLVTIWTQLFFLDAIHYLSVNYDVLF